MDQGLPEIDHFKGTKNPAGHQQRDAADDHDNGSYFIGDGKVFKRCHRYAHLLMDCCGNLQ